MTKETILETMASIQDAIQRMEAELAAAHTAVPPIGSERRAYLIRLEKRMNKSFKTGYVPTPRERRDMREFRDAVQRVTFLQSSINAERSRIDRGEDALVALDYLNGNTEVLSWLKGRETESGWMDAETQREQWVSQALTDAQEAGF